MFRSHQVHPLPFPIGLALPVSGEVRVPETHPGVDGGGRKGDGDLLVSLVKGSDLVSFPGADTEVHEVQGVRTLQPGFGQGHTPTPRVPGLLPHWTTPVGPSSSTPAPDYRRVGIGLVR